MLVCMSVSEDACIKWGLVNQVHSWSAVRSGLDGNFRQLSREKRPKRRLISLVRLGSLLGGKGARLNYRVTRTESALLSDAHHQTNVESFHSVRRGCKSHEA